MEYERALRWRKSTGDALKGIVEKLYLCSHWKDGYMIIRTDARQRFCISINAILYDLVKFDKVEVGSKIHIEYLGRDRKQRHVYSLACLPKVD